MRTILWVEPTGFRDRLTLSKYQEIGDWLLSVEPRCCHLDSGISPDGLGAIRGDFLYVFDLASLKPDRRAIYRQLTRMLDVSITKEKSLFIAWSAITNQYLEQCCEYYSRRRRFYQNVLSRCTDAWEVADAGFQDAVTAKIRGLYDREELQVRPVP